MSLNRRTKLLDLHERLGEIQRFFVHEVRFREDDPRAPELLVEVLHEVSELAHDVVRREVDEDEVDVRPFRTHLGLAVHSLIEFLRTRVDSRSIHEDNFRAIDGEGTVEVVSRRLRFITHDRKVKAEEMIDERALPGVWLSEHSNHDRFVMWVLVFKKHEYLLK